MLAIRLKHSEKIKGLCLDENNDEHVKISQYADDCMLFLNNIKELEQSIDILNEYGEVAGLILNLDKCEGI